MAAKVSPVVTGMRCPRCGHSWNLPRRADGTYPQTAACPKRRGGCGHVVKVPGQGKAPQRAAGGPAAADGPGAWDPPSQPRQPRPVASPCPHCGEQRVYAEPRGTLHLCLACKRRVTPPGVLAPYERGGAAVRQVTSRRERDDDAKRTVLMAGEFLRRVGELLGDPKIHPASADLLGWYQEEITEARKGRDAARLAELAGEFAADQQAGAFRRMHWWQGPPAALAAGPAEDDAEYADDDEHQDDAPAALQAPAAAPRRATWADAFAAHGWRLTPVRGDGICQVAGRDGHRCPEQIGGHPPVTDGLTRDGWVCSAHYYALGAAITSVNRARGIT